MRPKHQLSLIRKSSRVRLDGAQWKRHLERWLNSLAAEPLRSGMVNYYMGFKFIRS